MHIPLGNVIPQPVSSMAAGGGGGGEERPGTVTLSGPPRHWSSLEHHLDCDDKKVRRDEPGNHTKRG